MNVRTKQVQAQDPVGTVALPISQSGPSLLGRSANKNLNIREVKKLSRLPIRTRRLRLRLVYQSSLVERLEKLEGDEIH